MPETHRAGNLSSRATVFADIASSTSNRELRCHRLPIFEDSVLQSPLLAEKLSLSLSKSQQQRSSVSGEKDSRQLEFFAVILSSAFRQAQLEPFQQIITSLTHVKKKDISNVPYLGTRSDISKNHRSSWQKKSVYGCSSN